MALIGARGWNGTIRLAGDVVAVEKVRPKGYLKSGVDLGGPGLWTCSVTPQMSTRFKPAKRGSVRGRGSHVAGYIQVVGPGVQVSGDATTSGKFLGKYSEFLDLARDPTVLLFEKKHEPAVLDVHQAIEAAIHRSVAPVQDPATALRGLSNLMAEGIISAQELDWAKTNLLGQPPDRAQESLRLVRQLHDLFLAGSLNEAEYNQKKWELLSRR